MMNLNIRSYHPIKSSKLLRKHLKKIYSIFQIEPVSGTLISVQYRIHKKCSNLFFYSSIKKIQRFLEIFFHRSTTTQLNYALNHVGSSLSLINATEIETTVLSRRSYWTESPLTVLRRWNPYLTSLPPLNNRADFANWDSVMRRNIRITLAYVSYIPCQSVEEGLEDSSPILYFLHNCNLRDNT